MRSVVVDSSPEMIETLLDLLSRERSGHFVDFGCGTGNTLRTVARQFPKMDCVGVESDRNALAAAETSLKSRRLENASIVAGDIFSHLGIAHGTAYAYLGGALNQKLGHLLFRESRCELLITSKYPVVGLVATSQARSGSTTTYLYRRNALHSSIEWDYRHTRLTIQENSKYLLSRMFRLNATGPLSVHVDPVNASCAEILASELGSDQARAGTPTIVDLLLASGPDRQTGPAVFRITIRCAGVEMVPSHTLTVEIGPSLMQDDT